MKYSQGKILLSTKIILMISGFSIYLIIVFLLNKQSIKKFDYSFFSKQSFFIMLACTACLLIGVKFLPKHLMEINFTSVMSYLFLATSSVFLCILIWANCKETSWGHGLLGSLIQIPLLSLGSIVYIPLLCIAGFFKFLILFSGPPLLGKTQFQKDQEWYHNPQNPNGFHRYDKY